MERAARTAGVLQQEADELHKLAQMLNAQGRCDEAVQAYAQMHERLDQSTKLAREVGCVACVLGDPSCGAGGDDSILIGEELEAYTQLMPIPALCLPSGIEKGVMGRALGAVVGSLTADAAAMGVHWVYDLQVLQGLSQQAREACQRQQKDSSPYQELGRGDAQQQQKTGAGNSLDITATSSKLTPGAATELLPADGASTLQPRTASVPASGSGEAAVTGQWQAAPPLEFLDPPRGPFYSYASGRNSPYGEQVLVLLRSIAAQGGLNCQHYADSFAEAFEDPEGGYRDVSTKGFLANYARGLRPPFTGANDAQANCIVRVPPLVAAWAGSPGLFPAVQRATRVTQGSVDARTWACAAAGVLELVVLTRAAPSQAVESIASDLDQGHTAAAPGAPNQASDQAEERPFSRFAFAGSMGPKIAKCLRHAVSLACLAPGEVVAQLGRNCHMPNAVQTPLHIALHLEYRVRLQRGLDATAWDEASASALGELYAEGVRLAISEGGCCASRSAYVGSLLCGCCGFSNNGTIPHEWKVKYGQFGNVVDAAQSILRARLRTK